MLRLMIPTLTPTRAQLLMAFELVSGEGNGRVALGAKLGIGEGVVRTLIKHLLAEGLVEVSTRGVRASKKGERLLMDIHGVILRGIEAPATEDIVGGCGYIVLVRGARLVFVSASNREMPPCSLTPRGRLP